MSAMLLVGMGGFIGANLRHLLGDFMAGRFNTGTSGFPWGTMAANLSGAFLIGFISEWLLLRTNAPDSWRLFLVVGLLGGYTTFSSYTEEIVNLLEDDRLPRAMAYLLVTNAAGITLCLGGLLLAKRLI